MSLVLLEVSSYSNGVFLTSVTGWGGVRVSVKRLAVILIVRDAIRRKLNISVTNNIQISRRPMLLKAYCMMPLGDGLIESNRQQAGGSKHPAKKRNPWFKQDGRTSCWPHIRTLSTPILFETQTWEMTTKTSRQRSREVVLNPLYVMLAEFDKWTFNTQV